jgi:hypothetical protein
VDACVAVETEARYRDLPPAPTDRIFAVMENGQLLGIVSERQAALFPDRIFADLLLLRQPPTGAATTRVEQTLARLKEGPWDSLPVTNDEGTFRGDRRGRGKRNATADAAADGLPQAPGISLRTADGDDRVHALFGGPLAVCRKTPWAACLSPR